MLGFGGSPMAGSPAFQTGNEIVIKIAHMQIAELSVSVYSQRSPSSVLPQARTSSVPAGPSNSRLRNQFPKRNRQRPSPTHSGRSPGQPPPKGCRAGHLI
jgi:hypothetical protein